MANYEISQNLIDQVQILLHKESGVPPFNPPPSPLPSIVQDAISAVGSNAEDSVRCQGCNGELLRGFDSIICVFCGLHFNNNNNPNPPISFVSTFGFQLFLNSLSLDGSESVERLVEGGSESGRGRSPVKNEIPLSALLDLQLKWPDESNRFGVENDPTKQSTKLVGLNLDELCQTDGSREGASRSLNEQEGASKKFEIKEDTTFVGQSSLSLFENAQTRSNEGETDESDWAAEFQSANEDVKVESGIMDSTQWPPKQDKSARVDNSQAFSTSVIDSKSETPFAFNQLERNMLDKDGQKGLEMDDASFNWLPATDKQSITEKGDLPHNDKLVGNDSSNNWDEFGMFSGAENNRGEHVSATMPESESGGGFDISDPWNDFTGSLGVGHNQLQKGLDVDKPVIGAGDNFDLFGHAGMGHQDVHVESMLNKTNNLGASLELPDTAKEVNDSFDLWNNFKSSDIVDNNEQQFGNKEAPGNDDSFDVWSDFAQSTGALNSKPISNETSIGESSVFSSVMASHVNLLQRGETKSDENQTVIQNDDDFGSWSDFRSSLKQPDSGVSELNINGSSQDKINTGRDVDNIPAGDKNSHNSWGDFDWSTSILEQPSQAAVTKPSESNLASEDNDLFLGFYGSEKQPISVPDNQLKSNGSGVQNGKSSSGNDEEIDAWTDFTSSSNNQANNMDGSNVKTVVIQEPVIHDPFGEWNVISSAPNQESGRVTDMADGDFPTINIFGTNVDSNFVGSNSSMNQDPFLGMLNDQNGSAQVASSQTGVPDLVRTENRDVKAGDFDNGNEITSVVDNLISEMHDLSFMLDSSLSIPKPGS